METIIILLLIGLAICAPFVIWGILDTKKIQKKNKEKWGNTVPPPCYSTIHEAYMKGGVGLALTQYLMEEQQRNNRM